MTLEDAIKTADDKISVALNEVTTAAYHAGRDVGLEQAAVICERKAAGAQTPQGKGAALACAKEIRQFIRDVQS